MSRSVHRYPLPRRCNYTRNLANSTCSIPTPEASRVRRLARPSRAPTPRARRSSPSSTRARARAIASSHPRVSSSSIASPRGVPSTPRPSSSSSASSSSTSSHVARSIARAFARPRARASSSSSSWLACRPPSSPRDVSLCRRGRGLARLFSTLRVALDERRPTRERPANDGTRDDEMRERARDAPHLRVDAREREERATRDDETRAGGDDSLRCGAKDERRGAGDRDGEPRSTDGD